MITPTHPRGDRRVFRKHRQWQTSCSIICTLRDLTHNNRDGSYSNTKLKVDEYLLRRYREHWSGRGKEELEKFVEHKRATWPNKHATLHDIINLTD